MLWAAIWLTLVSNCPASQRWISAEELDYIENSSEDDTHTKVQTILYVIDSDT